MEPAACNYCRTRVWRNDKGQLVELDSADKPVKHECDGLRRLAEFDDDPFPPTAITAPRGRRKTRRAGQRSLF